MPTIKSFDRTKLFYTQENGNKGTIIFVHGWPHNHTVWDREMRYFNSHGYSTIAVDLRGHGKSGKPVKLSSYKMENFAKDINSIIKKHRIHKPILVGHSFGSMILLKFVEMFPDVPKSMVLIDATYHNPLKDVPFFKFFKLTNLTKHVMSYVLARKEAQQKHFKEIEFSKIKTGPDFYYWLKGAANVPVRSLAMCIKDMLNFDETSLLHKINVPCLIIQGERDDKTPKNVASLMNRRIKDSKLMIIKSATHNSNIKSSHKVNMAIKNFLADKLPDFIMM